MAPLTRRLCEMMLDSPCPTCWWSQSAIPYPEGHVESHDTQSHSKTLSSLRLDSMPEAEKGRGGLSMCINDVDDIHQFHRPFFSHSISLVPATSRVNLEEQMATMEDSTALVAGHHVQPKDRNLCSQHGALPSLGDVDMDIGDAWSHFEVARRSAEFYMDRYFQSLNAGLARPEIAQSVHLGAIETRGEHLRNGRYWDMKVARDCLIRDLNDMGFWIEQLSSSRQPKVKIPIGVACFSGVVISGLQHLRLELPQAVRAGEAALLLTLMSSCLDAAYEWTLTDGHQSVIADSINGKKELATLSNEHRHGGQLESLLLYHDVQPRSSNSEPLKPAL
ncbi:hypothetical protein NM208_g5521 [Fusarium decemcellulare]|uniref:Uncharacterized protein n=1 Tax=Fusarium decemcellulare TaxID=57161 RepID=A0ACC1SGW6_9HYPO|nr:hypothetical protein NM208_g5521 [Fusarium decemcellulare]